MATISRAQKVRLGIFVGFALTVFVGAFVLLVGRTLLQERDSYSIRFSSRAVSFSGLDNGAAVTYSGIEIGRVDGLRIAEDDVSVIEVTFTVPRGTPIAEDSVARLNSRGITGLKDIELSRGSKEARIRLPGETIPAGESLIDELSVKANSITDRLDALLESLQTLAGKDNQQTMQQILFDSKGLLEDNRGNIAGIIADARTVSGNVALASEQAVVVSEEARALMVKLNQVGSDVQGVLSKDGAFLKMVTRVDALMDRMNMLLLRSESDLEITMRNLREASANLNDFSLALRDDPRILYSNPRSDDHQDR